MVFDGHEFFPSYRLSCPHCSTRTVIVNKKPVPCFYLLNVKQPLRAKFTLIALARQILLGIVVMSNCPAQWLRPKNNSPPS